MPTERESAAVERQRDTITVPPSYFFGDSDFRLGFADARAGRRPRFDDHSELYETGRLFAVIAPRAMPIDHLRGPDVLSHAFNAGLIPSRRPR